MAFFIDICIILFLIAILVLLKDIHHYTRLTLLKLARSDYLPVTIRDNRARQRLDF